MGDVTYIVMKEITIVGASVGIPVNASDDKETAKTTAKALNHYCRENGDYTFYWVEEVSKI